MFSNVQNKSRAESPSTCFKVIALDLSTKCIGCFIAEVNGYEVTKCASYPFYPTPLNPEELGFKKSKKKIVTPKDSYSSYIKEGEESVSKAEKSKRDKLYRAENNAHMLKIISQELSNLILTTCPKYVVIEKNEIFGGVLTSVLLAKVNGVIHGICGTLNAKIFEYHVTSVRRKYPIAKELKKMSEELTYDELKNIPDKSKHAVKRIMEKKYNIEFNSCDESDAALVFDFWKEGELCKK